MSEKIIECGTVKSYEEDMVKYSIIVNRRRAFPEIKDGLKLVQRRTIYDMFIQGATENHKIKSASVTGDTMKLWHPHGSCLSGDTLVYDINGFVYRLEDLYTDYNSILVYAINEQGNIVKAKAYAFRIGQYTMKVYRITLSNGHTLKCTGNHPIMMDNGCFAKAEDLKVDDKLFGGRLTANGYDKTDSVSITNIVIDNQEVPTPMYDFTVDGYENMLIPIVANRDEIIENDVPVICVHNSSIYTCMISLATWFRCKNPLVAPHGNWGTVMGDGAAAERYTEAGLSNFCMDAVIGELKDSSGIVDWQDNYLRTKQEPEYLPVKVPILLINGSFGIGVGMAVNIPPHNLAEVISETRAVIKHPNHKVFLIPDHCQECEIIDADWQSICDTGRGSYKVRGKVVIGEEKGFPVIRILSLPDNVYTDMVTAKLEKMIVEKQLPMIRDIDDQSGKTVNIIIRLKKGGDANYVREVIYAKTAVQSTVSVNFEAVDGVDPRPYSYTEYIKSFIENRCMVKFRWYCNKLKDNMTRYHQLIAYIKIIESGEINNVIKMVEKQTTTNDDELMEYLIKKINVTDLQAKFILSTDIRRLSKGYLHKYKEEAAVLGEAQAKYRSAITDNGQIILAEIDKELADIAKRYGAPRISRIIDKAEENGIPKGIFKVVITEKNYLRKVTDTDKVGTFRNDNPKFILRVDNAENILLFDNKGKAFKLPVSKIPVTDRNSQGVDVRMLIKNLTSDIIYALYEPTVKGIVDGGRKHYFTVLTRDNLIKKLDMEDFLTVNQSGLLYTKLKDDDAVVGIAIVPADLDIVVYSNQKALRMPLKNIPVYKRNATGSRAMHTDSPLEGISVMYPDVESAVVVTAKGKINKFPVSGLTAKGRGKTGNNVIKLAPDDYIVSVFGVNEKDKIRILTSDGPVEVLVSELKSKSPLATGDKAIALKSATIVRCDVIY